MGSPFDKKLKTPPPPSVEDGAEEVFDPSKFDVNASYRVTFKNGNSSECDGAMLASSFPFDPAQVERIDKAQHIGGQGKDAA
jgi:hypothetical protein